MPAAWLVLATVLSLVCCAGVGFSAYRSESGGVNSAMISSFPLGFLMAGVLAALVTHFVARNPTIRALAPVGCGCLGGLGMFGLVFVFFVAIFPAL